MLTHRSRWLGLALTLSLAATGLLGAQNRSLKDEPNLTEEQKIQFLLNSKVVGSRHTSKGVTSPWRLTLSDGTLTHDAAFQTINEHKNTMQFSDGRTELNFIDASRYDIAAYKLAKLLDLDNMMPVTVERKWNGETGALSWWIPWKWDEAMRVKEKIDPPDVDAWNKQMYRKRVFAQLVYDTDPNLTNLLITEDWHIWMIDFTRAFRLFHDLQNPKDLVQCDRHLLAKLRQLDEDEVMEKTKPHLTKGEVKAVMARRDKIVSFFDKQVAKKSENEVLY
jgi:hypothetical protein